ncbi:MAG TPA: hypothetical protein VEA15_06720 [Caulobacteraceae bacterium]|nr:hypothetical protein [Caulobacteraceae bacterium]
MRTLALTLALSFAALAGAASAQGGSDNNLKLANADKAPAKIIVDGTIWKCASGVCIATGGKSQSADRACRRVVAKLGQVTAFTWRGETLSPEAVAACNAAA